MQSQLLIDGHLVNGQGATQPVYNPATGEVIAQVAEASPEQVDRAVLAADAAFAAWGQTTPKERAEHLLKLADLIDAHAETFARLESLNCGKPYHCVLNDELPAVADVFRFFAGASRCLTGMAAGEYLAGHTSMIRRDPLGVVASIAPWNYPLMMAAWKLAPALAAGNCVVIKPSEQTPLTTFKLAELAAGLFPPGVLNVLFGRGASVGDRLTGHDKVRMVSLTGSIATGEHIIAHTAAGIKRTHMELGGKAPVLVFDDADLDAAVAGAVASKYRNAGQTCVCTNRFLVQDGVYDAFAAKLKAAVAKLKVGNGLDEGVTIGPLINPDAVEKVREHIADAVEHGASVLLGGKPDALGGNFFTPTILTDVPRTAKIFREETFGPVAPLIRFNHEADAVELANDTPFGLAAYFYSRDIGRVMRVAEALEYGIVGINEGLISTEVAPFGGMKHSGLGREGSKYGIEDYLEIKYLCLGGLGA